MDCIKDLQDAIRNILVNNGLTELCLGEPDELDDPTYIIWYDRHCEPHEDPVLKVYLENEGIAVEVEARSFGNTITVYDYDIDRIEWWKGIHANILEVLERDGKRRCPACGRPAVPHYPAPALPQSPADSGYTYSEGPDGSFPAPVHTAFSGFQRFSSSETRYPHYS